MHEFDLKSSDEAITEEISKFPDGFDFNKTNLAQILLLGKPEERDPARYAKVFSTVKRHPKASVWMRYASWAEKINGERRIKGADMPKIAADLHVLLHCAKIDLSNGNNKYILLGTANYNLGIIRRGFRKYTEAAQAQREASAWYGLAGNTGMQYVCLFVAAVEQATQDFIDGGYRKIDRAIKMMVALREHIQCVVSPYPDWMQKNAAIHIRWAQIMAQHYLGYSWFGHYDQENEDFRYWGEHASAHWIKAAHVIKQYEKCEFSQMIRQDVIDTHSSSADNAGLTVKIFVALAHKKLGNKDEYKKILTAVANHTGPDGGIPIAVANQLLKCDRDPFYVL